MPLRPPIGLRRNRYKFLACLGNTKWCGIPFAKWRSGRNRTIFCKHGRRYELLYQFVGSWNGEKSWFLTVFALVLPSELFGFTTGFIYSLIIVEVAQSVVCRVDNCSSDDRPHKIPSPSSRGQSYSTVFECAILPGCNGTGDKLRVHRFSVNYDMLNQL